MEYVLRTFDLVKSYKKQKALDGLSMNIKKGDIYGFVGENGSGKTTVIRLINGLIFANSGDYELFGVKSNSKDIYNVRRKVGAIVESPSIYKNMSAKDNILMQASILGIDYSDKVENILNVVGLSDVYNSKKKAGDFSLGMRQRLGIAMCLVSDPEFLILDEPMNGLDPAGIVELRELIIRLNQEKGITFLISSHILTELALVATTYGIISKGKMIKEISSEELNSELRRTINIGVEDAVKTKEVLISIIKEDDIKFANNGLSITGDYNVDDIVKLLVNNGIIVTSINCSQASIEDYYMNTVGGRNHA